jgi:hypothetical protein
MKDTIIREAIVTGPKRKYRNRLGLKKGENKLIYCIKYTKSFGFYPYSYLNKEDAISVQPNLENGDQRATEFNVVGSPQDTTIVIQL